MLPGLSMVMHQSDEVSGFTVVANPTSASGTKGSSGATSITVTSNSVIATASGGSGSYSYAWADESSSGIAATSSASASTAFSESLAPDGFDSSTFLCTATDTVTGAKATVDVHVSLHHVDLR